jgi:hypothetical protein
MKQKNNLLAHKIKRKCDAPSCLSCKICSAINYEEARPEWKNDSIQLYAREAEHYFFYYNPAQEDVKLSV